MNNRYGPWRDGPRNPIIGDAMFLVGGWNPTEGVFPSGNSTDEIWKSTNKGADWNLLDIRLPSPRHYFGCKKRPSNGLIHVWNSDVYGPGPLQDMWTWDGENEFQLITNASGDPRIIPMFGMIDDKPTMGGGQETDNDQVVYNDFVQFNFDTLVWDVVGLLPVPAASTAPLFEYKGSAYFVGGGIYDGAGGHTFNTKMWKSDGKNYYSWSEVCDLPEKITGYMYPAATVMGNKVFLQNGYGNGINNPGTFYYNLDNNPNHAWVETNLQYPQTHAASMETNDDDDEVYIIGGNEVNAVAMIKKTVV